MKDIKITVDVNGFPTTFDIDEGSETGELLLCGNEEQSINLFELGTKREDFILPIVNYMREVNGIELEFNTFGMFHHHLYFYINMHELIQNFK